MVLRAPDVDPAQLIAQVPGWMGRARKEAHRALGEVEVGVRCVVEETASAIASRAHGEVLPTIDEIQEDTLRILGAVEPLIDGLADRMVSVLDAQLRPLDRLGDELSRASLRSARSGWARTLRAYASAVGQYVAGFVEGGGIAIALWTELPPELSGHIGEISSILAERLAFVALRAEGIISRWLSEVQEELEDLLRSMTPSGSSDGQGSRSERLAQLLVKASTLGVRVKSPPEAPSDAYLHRLESQLRSVEARVLVDNAGMEVRRTRKEELLALAASLKVTVQRVPVLPSDAYLDRLQGRLIEVAERKGVAVPPHLGGPTPAPAPEVRSEEVTRDVSSQVDPERFARIESLVERAAVAGLARIESLVERAAVAGLDLGQIPSDPTMSWIVMTEARLQATIARRDRERRATRKSHEAARRARIERLHHQAEHLGIPLAIPAFPTDEWLDRAELRIAALLLTPDGGAAPSDAGRAERFNRLYAMASACGVDLGAIPTDPDEAWLDRAEHRLIEAGCKPPSDKPEPDEVAAGAALVFESGTIQEQIWPVGDLPVSIGRARDNTVQLREDVGVSRHHCTVHRAGVGWLLRDEGSTKGTWVDGRRVREVGLVGGEEIRLGETRLSFRAHRPSAHNIGGAAPHRRQVVEQGP